MATKIIIKIEEKDGIAEIHKSEEGAGPIRGFENGYNTTTARTYDEIMRAVANLLQDTMFRKRGF